LMNRPAFHPHSPPFRAAASSSSVS
jgi:hypothetical protein